MHSISPCTLTRYIGPAATSLCLSFGLPKNTPASLAHGSPENREALPRLGLPAPDGQHWKHTPPRSAFRDRAEAKRTHPSCVRLQSDVDLPSLIRRVPWGVSVETRRLQSDNGVAGSHLPIQICCGTSGCRPGMSCSYIYSVCVAQGRSSMCLTCRLVLSSSWGQCQGCNKVTKFNSKRKCHNSSGLPT